MSVSIPLKPFDHDKYTDDKTIVFWIPRNDGKSFVSGDRLKSITCATIKQHSNESDVYILTELVRLMYFDGTYPWTSVFAVLREPFVWNSKSCNLSFKRLYDTIMTSGFVLFRKIDNCRLVYRDTLVSLQSGMKHGPTIVTEYEYPKSLSKLASNSKQSTEMYWFWDNQQVSKTVYNRNNVSLNFIFNVVPIQDLARIIKHYLFKNDYNGYKTLTSSIIHDYNCFTRDLFQS